jgi:hypothetical protein
MNSVTLLQAQNSIQSADCFHDQVVRWVKGLVIRVKFDTISLDQPDLQPIMKVNTLQNRSDFVKAILSFSNNL